MPSSTVAPAVALAVLAGSAGHAAAQAVTIDLVQDLSANRTFFNEGASGTAESAADDLGVASPSPGRFVATSRLRWAHAYSVVAGGPTAALLFRRHYEFDTVFTVADPDDRGYELELDAALGGELIVLGPDNAPDATAGNIIATCGFNARFDDDATDATDTLGLSGLVLGANLGESANADVDGDRVTIDRVDESRDASLGTFVGTRTFAVRLSTRTAPAGVIMQNNIEGDAALVFGLEATQPADPDDEPPALRASLDGLTAATILPGDGLTKTLTVTFFCNAGDIAPPAGVLDLADVDAFVAGFSAGDAVADIAEPFGVLDLADIDAFIAAFLFGCDA